MEEILQAEAQEAHAKLYDVPDIGAVRLNKGYLFVKRLFDIVLGAVLLAVFALPMLIIGIVIRLDSPGPAIFRQERLGLHGRPFHILKFRTMRQDAEEHGPQWAQPGDRRVTAVGKFIRTVRLDELPQLINIISGEMSFVGPRPERAYFYKEFETYIKGFSQRMKVKPGLTGLAQVNGGYDLAPEEKIVYDMEYIRRCSVKMDIICMLKTVLVVLHGSGAR